MKTDSPFILQPEYGKWMIEVVPRDPFKFEELYKIETSLQNLYKFVNENIGKDSILSLSSNPILGMENYYFENKKYVIDEDNIFDVYENPFSKSEFFKDVCINSHPRFGYCFFNI